MFKEYQDEDYMFDDNGVKYISTPNYNYNGDIGLLLLLGIGVHALLFFILN